jgi:hypothetical protein
VVESGLGQVGNRMPRDAWSGLLIVSTVAFSWLAMMAVHESGHVLHAWLSGGRVERVVLHPLTISRTDVDPNPLPHFVAWGGAVWGCGAPLLAWAVMALRQWRVAYLFRFFAGFCLIANGAYLGAAVVRPVGDAADLIRLGTPAWVLGLGGATAIACGLWVWNGLGPHFGLGRTGMVHRRDAVGMSLVTAGLIAAAVAFG